jgi:hypothetical protein
MSQAQSKKEKPKVTPRDAEKANKLPNSVASSTEKQQVTAISPKDAPVPLLQSDSWFAYLTGSWF